MRRPKLKKRVGARAALLLFLLAWRVFAEPVHPLIGWNFDWDDNIMFMKTKIVLFKKGTQQERPVSTGEFAQMRELLGKPGTEWENYETRDVEGGSFRYFRDARGKNYFLEDMLESLKANPREWMGPSWEAFVEACSRPETARQVSIITARGHSPEKMYEALKKLRDMGYIKYLPPLKKLILVGSPKFGGNSADPSARKAFYMMQFLDEMQKQNLRGDMEVVSPDGKGKAKMHLWGFSDDDYGNFEKAVKELGAAIKAKPDRWNKIKISIFYTGKNKPGMPPHGVVLGPDGEPRPMQVVELAEVKHILGEKHCSRYYDWLTQLKK